MTIFKVPKFVKSVRYSLAVSNGIFLLTGILLLLTGVVILVQYNEFDSLTTTRVQNLPAFVIATGVIICLVSVLGFYGALSEQFYVLLAYLICLLVILVFEVSIIIISYALYNDAAREIRSTMASSMQLYGSRIEVARVWDDLQMTFECCGVAGRLDWGTSSIPVSCCHIDFGTISPFVCTSANSYMDGCAAVLGEWIGLKAYVIGVTSIVVTVLQILLTAATGWFTWRSKFEEVELES